MLQFFRKYQKFFFLFVTIITVFSFVFFGTYQSFTNSFKGRGEDESHVTQMTRFLDTEAWMSSHKIFATNFLNDGVISKDFLETGIGDSVARTFAEHFAEEFAACHEKEIQYIPYSHPSLPSLNAEMVWSVFAPDLPEKLREHQKKSAGFKERRALYLASTQMPAAYFSQFIRYQEQSNPQAPRDPRLARDDISLFGYQSLSDWFGKAYVEKVAELIIKTADVARKKGYKVSQQEVLAELVARSQEVYMGVKDHIELPVTDGYGLFQFYLRQNGMTEESALKIWEDVTLFRRLLHEVGDAALVDPLSSSQFYAYAYENAQIELYQLPAECRFKSLADLELFETYLAAVGNKSAPLDIPREPATIEEIEAKAPSLVGRRYSVYYAQTSKQALQSKVSIKETMNWECEPASWAKIQQQFPEFAQKQGSPFEILEQMETRERKLVDAFARKQIVDAHPEWIEEALLTDKMIEKDLFLSFDPSQKTFEGIKDVKKLSDVLNEQNEVARYTQDNVHFYRFLVKEKGENTVLSFKEALKEGLLTKLAERLNGKALAQAVVEACPAGYREMAHAYRFAPFVAENYAAAPTGALAAQFKIEKMEKTIVRCGEDFIDLETVLALEPGHYSQVQVDPAQGAYLYRFIEKRRETTLPVEKMVQTQEILSKEARCKYFETLLESL